ncbi:dUTP diphosphatase [Pseudomonas capeferrum]
MNRDSVTIYQARTMLNLQSTLNAMVDPAWLSKKFPYLRAAFVEAAEALDHHGWKWWKKQEPNLTQVQIEISDILHFYLSDILIESAGDQQKAEQIFVEECADTTSEVTIDDNVFSLDVADVPTLLELLAALAVLRKRSFPVFQSLMIRCQLDWESLYVNYTSKNVLNIFRQLNGYKDGTYIKMWAGREDNEHLADIVAALDTASADFSDQIEQALIAAYSLQKQSVR